MSWSYSSRHRFRILSLPTDTAHAYSPYLFLAFTLTCSLSKRVSDLCQPRPDHEALVKARDPRPFIVPRVDQTIHRPHSLAGVSFFPPLPLTSSAQPSPAHVRISRWRTCKRLAAAISGRVQPHIFKRRFLKHSVWCSHSAPRPCFCFCLTFSSH